MHTLMGVQICEGVWISEGPLYREGQFSGFGSWFFAVH